MDQVDVNETIWLYFEMAAWLYVLETITGVDRFTIYLLSVAESLTETAANQQIASGAIRSFLWSQKGN